MNHLAKTEKQKQKQEKQNMKTEIITIASLALLSSAAHSQSFTSTVFASGPGDKTGTLTDGSSVTVTNTSGGFFYSANNPTWTSEYGSTVNFFRVPVSDTMDISFSGGTAPSGTRLVIIDVDNANESVTFSGAPSITPMSFFDSTDVGGGGPPAIASWDAGTSTLSPSSIAGNRNATVFDLSGTGSFTMTTGSNDGLVVGVYSSVPEPSSFLLASLGALGLLTRRKR